MAEEYNSGFSFRIHSYGTGGKAEDGSRSVGHFSIELIRPNGESMHYGFYPQDDGRLGMLFGTDAEIREDNKVKANFSNHQISKPVPLSQEQVGKMGKYMEEVKKSPGDYSLLGRNCEEFVQEVIDASGVKARTQDFLSKEQWGQLNLAKFGMSRPQHQSYAERTAPNHSSRPGQVDKTPSEPLSEAEFRKIMADYQMGHVLGEPNFREKAVDNLLPIVKGRENFEAQKKQMNEQSEIFRQRENQRSLGQSRDAAEAAGVDNQRLELQPMDFETREEYERYIAQQRGPDDEQKQPAPDAAKDAGRDAGRDADPDQHSDAGDTQQQAAQQFADATIDTGGGNNGRNYAAELAALPPGRAVRLNWLLQKSPDQWTQQELDDAQASRPYWDSRAPRHDEVQAAVSDVYRYIYGDGSRGFRPDGSLPRAEPINKLLDAALPDSASAGNSLMPQQRLQAWPETGPETGWPQTGPQAWPQTGPLGRLPTGTPPFIPEGPHFPEWQLRRQYDLADLGALMEDIPLFDSRLFQDQKQARTAPARYLQQAINNLLWPGKAAPTVAGIQGKPYKSGPILVDGEIGPVTAQALDQVEAMPDGLAALSQGVKRNAARDLVRSIVPDMPIQPLAGQELARQLDQAVSLFRDPTQPHANSVRHLQQGLNRLSMESEGRDEAWQPIAVDGQLGPQTAGGFAQLAKRLPAETMASVFDLGPSYLGPSYLGGGAPAARKTKAASQMPQLSARDPNPRQRMRANLL